MKRVIRVKALGDTPYFISEEPGDIIGRGSYGRVIRAYSKTNLSKRYVAKIFELSNLKQHRSGLQQLSIVSRLPKSPNLVNYEKIKLTSKNFMYLVMEECNGGTLTQLIHGVSLVTEDEIQRFVRDFLRGYRCVYQSGIVHRDIKTDNILIHDGVYKIADFGLSKITQQQSKTTSIKGSPVFLAPELFRKGPSGSKLDVYSFGVTLYYMCYKSYPYTTKNKYSSFEQLIRDIGKTELFIPQGRSEWLQTLLRQTLQKDPNDRISWPELFSKYKYLEDRLIDKSQPVKSHQFSAPLIELKTVQNSNTDMRDLQLLDMDLLLSLRPESVLLLNELEKSLIRKRELVVFLDRVRGKLRQFNQIDAVKDFRELIVVYNWCTLTDIEDELSAVISRLNAKDQMQFCESKNYRLVWKLISEDKQEVQSQLPQKKYIQHSTKTVRIHLYRLCSSVITVLIQQHNFKTAVYLLEIEKFLKGDITSMLALTNKDIQSVDRFITDVETTTDEKTFKATLRSNYEHLLL